MSEQDLDTRIRSLVARAVADAPAPAELDPASVLEGRYHDRERHLHRGWWVGGGAALLAAAAAITTVVLVADTDDRISTPADTTLPAVETTVPPTAPATVVPPSTLPAPPDPTIPVVVPPPTVPPSTTPPVTPMVGEEIATAGPDGVVLRDRLGTELRRLEQPALRAVPVGDGRVVVELGVRDADETEVVIWYADGTTSTPFPPIEPPEGRIAIEDVAVIDGGPVLLFQFWTGAQDTLRSVLYAAPLTIDGLDESRAASLGVVGGYEWGVSRLDLANNGLVVGTSSSESSYSLYVAALPETPATDELDAVSPAALGLEDSYAFVDGCDRCPAGFSVDNAGARVGWVEGNDLVDTDLASGRRAVTPVGDAVDPAVDVDLAGDGALFSYGPFGDRPPMRLAGTSLSPLEGYSADLGPTLPTDLGAPVTPATIAPDRIVTAGRDGVAVLEDGAEVRRLEQPAEVAFGTPGGAVIFQPARPIPDGQPGDPLIWRPDGTVERLLGELPERQSYRLHDVTEVGGVPTVLYGIATRAAGEGAEMDVSEFTEVLHALTMTPGGWTDVVLDEMPTWESGWSQLTLAADGLVVGEQSELVEHHLYSAVIPGSPAAAAGPLEAAALGLAASYGDEESPRAYGISPDGTSVAWTVGTAIVVHTLATGAERSWGYPGLTDVAVRGLAVRVDDDGAVTVGVVSGWPQTAEGTATDVVTLRPDGSLAVVPVTAAHASFAP